MKASSVSSFLVLTAVLLLGGCSSSSFPEVSGPQTPDGTGNGDPEPTPIGEITDDSVVLLARSVMSMTGGLAAIGEITTEMVRKGVVLLDDPERTPGDAIDLPECNEEIPPGQSVNRIAYDFYNPGFGQLPPGELLRASLVMCTIQGLLVDGTLEITTISYTGNPSGDAGNWSFSALVYLSPFDFLNPNDTRTSYLDKYRYTAVKSGGVLTVDIEAAADPLSGLIGGLNAQHHLALVYNNDTAINYQFRPYRITLVDDGDVGEYRVIVQSHTTDGDSLLNRYTTSPASDIKLTVATDPVAPIIWQGGRPATYLDVPSSGQVSLVDGGSSIVAAVDGDGVVLTVTIGGIVTAGSITWEELLTSPES